MSPGKTTRSGPVARRIAPIALLAETNATLGMLLRVLHALLKLLSLRQVSCGSEAVPPVLSAGAAAVNTTDDWGSRAVVEGGEVGGCEVGGRDYEAELGRARLREG